jgi:hypothetical protein
MSRRKRTRRIQRLVVLILVLFLAVFLIALGVRSCQQNRKESSYKSYVARVEQIIADSNAVGADLKTVIENPSQFTRAELRSKLQSMAKKQTDVANRAKLAKAPDKLATEHELFALGMQVRANGMRQMSQAIQAAMSGPGADNKKIAAADLVALSGYFTGPDAYYMDVFYTHALQVLRDDKVSGVAVPVSTFYLKSQMFAPATLKSMLTRIDKSANLSGIHGVAVTGVTVTPGNQKLQAGRDNQVKAAAGMGFTILVQNQGTADEPAVPVKVTLKLAGGAQVQTVTKTIDAIKAGKTASLAVSGFNIDANAIGRKSTIIAEAGPVPREAVRTNNKLQFTIILTLD